MLGFLNEGETDEGQTIYRRADHSDLAGSGKRSVGDGHMPQAQLLGAVILSLEIKVWRHGCVRGKEAQRTRAREFGAEGDGRGAGAGHPDVEGRKQPKVVSLAERRRCVTYLRERYTVSERRACQAMEMNRSSYRYAGTKPLIDEVYERVVGLSHQYPCWGYRKIYDLLRAESVSVSRERVRHIRRREGLQIVRKRRKRRVLGMTTQWVHQAEYPGHVWSYDFVFDQSDDGRQLKCLTVVDEFTREGLTIEVARSITAGDVIRILERLFEQYGPPVCIRSDNGPEFVCEAVRRWLGKRQVDTHYIDPGSPWQNAYCESFNSIFRTTCLDRWLFCSLTEARVVINRWLEEYNTIRPHGSLNGTNPLQFHKQWIENNMNQQPEILTA